jgi:hypothetical protein
MKRLLLTLVLLWLSGCMDTREEGGWVKPGASAQDFYADRGGCVAQAFQSSTTHQRSMILAGCMQSKGWHWEGRLP